MEDGDKLSEYLGKVRDITKVRSLELARELKSEHTEAYTSEREDSEEVNSGHLVYYDYGLEEYKLTPLQSEQLDFTHLSLGRLTWQEVMDNTGRDNIRIGDGYIYDWIKQKLEGSILYEHKEDIDNKDFVYDGLMCNDLTLNVTNKDSLEGQQGYLRYNINYLK